MRTAGTHILKYVTGPLLLLLVVVVVVAVVVVVVVVVVVAAAAVAANSRHFARFSSHPQNISNLCPSSIRTFKRCTLDDSEGRVYNNMEESGRGLF